GYIYHALSASAKVASIKALNNGAGKVRVIIKSEDELSVDVVKEYLSADERRPLTDEVNVELAKKREFIVDAKLLLLELSRANEISQKINALQKDFDLSVDLALGFIYKCLHQDGVYKSEILSIKEKIINEEEQELKDLPLENIIIADDEFATLSFLLSYEKAVL
ncbi:baseplate assembly protein, partial [Campylobacter jejuni]|nr:baseplate assembly protein [Campylobacter jejuni]